MIRIFWFGLRFFFAMLTGVFLSVMAGYEVMEHRGEAGFYVVLFAGSLLTLMAIYPLIVADLWEKKDDQ